MGIEAVTQGNMKGLTLKEAQDKISSLAKEYDEICVHIEDEIDGLRERMLVAQHKREAFLTALHFLNMVGVQDATTKIEGDADESEGKDGSPEPL